MSLWDQLPESWRSGGGLDALEPLLSDVPAPSSVDNPESDGTWRIWTEELGGSSPLGVDLTTGATTTGSTAGTALPSSGGALEIAMPVQVQLGLRLDSAGDPDGTVRVVLDVPAATLQVPFLRGATLDGRGQLVADPAHPHVRFHLPSLRVRLLRPDGGSIGVDLLSASTTGAGTDSIYEFIRMEPAHALIGPGDVVGFAFRTAVLDLSGTEGPSGVPAEARTMPAQWQGLYLPEVRLFVAPDGLEGIAVSAGVRDLWIGVGAHEGVTGVFNAEVVNRGAAPVVRLRAVTPSGEMIGIPDVPDGHTGTHSVTVELPEDAAVVADAGGGLAPYTYAWSGGTPVPGTTDRVSLTLPSSGTVTVQVTVTDSTARTTTREVVASRRAAPAPGTPAGPHRVAAQTTSSTGHRLQVTRATATHATVTLTPVPDGTLSWAWSGGSATGETAEIPVSGGAPLPVTVTVGRTSGTTTSVSGYMGFDRPSATDLGRATTPWSQNPDNIRATPWRSRTDPGTSAELFDATGEIAQLADLPTTTPWQVDGWASFEASTATNDPGHRTRNRELARRRRDAMVAVLRRMGFTDVTPVEPPTGDDDAFAATDPQAPRWWRATATADVTQTLQITGTLRRVLTPQPSTELDPAPTPAPVPDCFRLVGVTVELVRGTLVRAEVYGELDIDTAVEQRLRSSGAPALAGRNPGDGITRFLARLRIAEDRSSWDVTLQVTADRTDTDGLWQGRKPSPSATDTGLDVLGAVAVFGPLMAATTPESPTAGELVPMALLGGTAVALGASGVMSTQSVTLRAVEVMVTDGLVDPATGDGPRSTQVSVLLDVETVFTFDLGFLQIDPARPLTARYNAMGVRSSWTEETLSDGSIEYVPLPVFDPSRGYSLDIPAGTLIGPPAFQDLLRTLGGRISRDNPTFLEIEVGLGIELGPVSMDSARVRICLEDPSRIELTALTASIELPGTLHGSGSIAIFPSGFGGAFDVTLTPLNIRVAATLSVRTTPDGVTGVLFGAEVEFPPPGIVLGQSGLGIFGFLGGVAVNERRLEPAAKVPALAWFEQQLGKPGGLMHWDGWQTTGGSFAVAGGVLLGTVDGGFMIHLKGIVLVEVPGPRLLFAMKADVLKLPPVLGDKEQKASFLAVLDLDIGRGSITIGIVAQYEIESLLLVRVPVTAYFSTTDLDAWFIELGSYSEPVTVQVLDAFSGTGYLMIHGNGEDVTIPGLEAVITSGLTVATGFHLRAVLMGSKAVGLYLEVAAGFDAVVSFEPFSLGGRIYVAGELRLWVVGISASAELTVICGPQRVGTTVVNRTYVHGEVCGSVDLFFFEVKGCVSLTIGEEEFEPLDPDPLVAGVVLVSRSPALVEGSAVDRSVDGVLGTALEPPLGADDTLPEVPIDSIPVIRFTTAPTVVGGGVVLGGVARASGGLPAHPWVRRGDRWWRYEVESVELVGPLQPTGGATPATWWLPTAPVDPAAGATLALLSWLPTPTPRAVPLGEQLRRTVQERWGRICTPVARPAAVLWTFDGRPVGASATGWRLDGVPWPDDPGTWRSEPVRAGAEVTEPWRTGDQLTDLLLDVDPAVVVGDRVPCTASWDRQPATHVPARSTTGFTDLPVDGPAGQDTVDLIADGTSLTDLGAGWAHRTWEPDPWAEPGDEPEPDPGCEGRVLRAPFGDDGRPPEKGADPYGAELARRGWDLAGHEPSDLADSVRIHVPAGVTSLELLLLVLREQPHPVLRFYDTDGVRLGERAVTSADLLGGGLPPSWTDAGGPWAGPVTRSLNVAVRVVGERPGLFPALVSTDPPDGTVTVEIGMVRGPAAPRTPFWVVAWTGLTAAEQYRHSWDETTVTQDADDLAESVAQDPDDHALLVPGQEYTVRVRWRAASVKQEAKPAGAPGAWGATRTQEYRFRADDAVPERLDPWVMATTPAPGEVGFLTADTIRLALATQKVAELFDAYGRELRVVVRAASGRHPEPPGGGAPGDAVVVPVEVGLTGPLGVLDAVAVMTPWQEAATELLEALPCTSAEGSTTHHSVITLAYDLEPLTDYLLDVYAVVKGSGPDLDPEDRVYRVPFTTSRFATVADLAGLTWLADPRHTVVPVPAAIQALSERPTGHVLDQAFQDAGLAVPEVPRYPSVTVLWSPDAVPQPVAVVVESGETMWRSRPTPTKVTGPADAADPTHQWWAARDADWLLLAASGALVETGEPARAPVTRIVRGPGDTRAVVLLGPGARGTEVRLDLVHAADALAGTAETRSEAVRVLLARAPWEVED